MTNQELIDLADDVLDGRITVARFVSLVFHHVETDGDERMKKTLLALNYYNAKDIARAIKRRLGN